MLNSKIARRALSVSLAVLSLLVITVLWREQLIASGLLLVIGAGLMAVNWHRKLPYIYILAGVGGPVAEIISIHAGAWMYAEPWYLGVPLWLPFLWGNAALFIARWRSGEDVL